METKGEEEIMGEKDMSTLWVRLGEVVKEFQEAGWTLADIKAGMELLWDGVEIGEGGE